MQTVTLARHAMATRFELVLNGENPVALQAAGEEALAEIERIEAQLSLYRSTSEIAHLNARAAHEPVRVTPSLFALLQRAKKLSEESTGAFDITVAPLMRCWGFMDGTGQVPDPDELAKARGKVGMHLVRLDPEIFTVEFAHEGVMLDLGAIGKGHAIEQAAGLLREAGVVSALLHGGTSTVHAIGHPPDAEFWKVAIETQSADVRSSAFRRPATTEPPEGGTPNSPDPPITVPLKDEAMSVSAVWGKSFQADGKTFGHVLDPRTGQPATTALLAAVVLPSATETDALSTALLTSGRSGHEQIAGLRPGMRTVLVTQAEEGFRVEANGFELPGMNREAPST